MKKRTYKNLACRCPSVTRCLNCTKPECDVVCGVPLDRSEIVAEVNAGVLNIKALWQHDRRQGKLKKQTNHCRTDAVMKGEY